MKCRNLHFISRFSNCLYLGERRWTLPRDRSRVLFAQRVANEVDDLDGAAELLGNLVGVGLDGLV